jgi:actin-like ATPase involved in cell morphogenesis
MSSVIGISVGNGNTNVVLNDRDGSEQATTMPSVIDVASAGVVGGLREVTPVTHDGVAYWAGSVAAELSDNPITNLGERRLRDTRIIPVLTRAALDSVGLNGNFTGHLVTGLPAAQSLDKEQAKLLGERLRQAAALKHIRVIAEPLGLIFSVLLDPSGSIVEGEYGGRVGAVDIGHHTLDSAEINHLRVTANTLNTWQLGTAWALGRIRTQLSSQFGREYTLYQTDQAIRAGAVRVGNRTAPLPAGWDAPLLELGEQIAARLGEEWRSGGQFDAIVIGGGGANLHQLTAPILRTFPHATIAPDPQSAIPRGYARYARRLEQQQDV